MEIWEAPTKRNMMQNILHEWEKDWSRTEAHWAAREMKTIFFLPNLNEKNGTSWTKKACLWLLVKPLNWGVIINNKPRNVIDWIPNFNLNRFFCFTCWSQDWTQQNSVSQQREKSFVCYIFFLLFPARTGKLHETRSHYVKTFLQRG